MKRGKKQPLPTWGGGQGELIIIPSLERKRVMKEKGGRVDMGLFQYLRGKGGGMGAPFSGGGGGRGVRGRGKQKDRSVLFFLRSIFQRKRKEGKEGEILLPP